MTTHKKSPTTRRRLSLERLEGRQMCAGDVTVALVGDTLAISGDNAANYVDVQQKLIGGVVKFVVTGKSFDGSYDAAGNPIISGPATKINGKTTPFRAAAKELNIFMNRGNDAVVVGGRGLPVHVDSLNLVTGARNDYALVKDVTVVGGAGKVARIEMTQADGVHPDGQKEAGTDKVVINGLQVVNGDLTVATGGGKDTIQATNVRDENGVTYVYAGNGPDTLSITNGQFQSVNVLMGNSADRDVVRVKSVDAKRVNVNLGAGNNDLLKLVSDVKVRRKTILNGGAGTGDKLDVGSNVSANGLSVTGFEITPPGI